MLGNIKMKAPASKKITAYGLRKEGAKTIIELLDEAQGYSRKFDVLWRLVNKKLNSERKFNNGLSELDLVGFVKIIRTDNTPERIKLDKRIWDRNPDVIRHEHNLIEKRLNQSGHWLKPQTLIRDIRNAIEQKTKSKPSFYAVNVHLKIFLSQHDHDENENGLIRLAKFRNIDELSPPKKNNNVSLFDYIPEKPTNSLSANPESIIVNDENEIDFDQDEDIFENDQDDNFSGNTYDDEDGLLEGGIAQDIFGNNSEGGSPKFPEESMVPKKESSDVNVATKGLLKYISEELTKVKEFDISESFNKLSIKINNISITLTYDPSRQELSSTSLHNLKGDEIIEALRSFGKSDMIGQLSIDRIKGIDFMLLRMKILVTKYNISEIMSMVERIIYEAIQLQEIKEQS